MKHSKKLSVAVLVVFVALTMTFGTAFAAKKPNIVLVFLDNFGWGEPGFNGGEIIRGAETLRMDTLASEGLRLTNFNVESQCTPSRSAIMTGRYAIRSGNDKAPQGGGVYGLVQWEITMAEMLSDAGYATGMFGKWHPGRTPGRFPTDQGFDEWYGIPNSTDEAPYMDLEGFKEIDTIFGEVKEYGMPKIYNLYRDPGERESVTFPHTWVAKAATPQLIQHIVSLRKEPPIKPGTKDPYEPPKAQLRR